MKPVKLLLMLAAFLVMVSSVITLTNTIDRTAVYINIAAMMCLTAAITFLNFRNKPDKKE
ncbi:MAG: hypothetical protein LBR65_06970 [Culturomica sp.]|jgi:hypothetical protein|nr:hypothetical protein [Culturomica sp.]